MKIKNFCLIFFISILIIVSSSNTVYGTSNLFVNISSSEKVYKEGTYSANSYNLFKTNKNKWKENAEYIYNELIKNGATPTGACAILGNITAKGVETNINCNYLSNKFDANKMIQILKSSKCNIIRNKMKNVKEKDLLSNANDIRLLYPFISNSNNIAIIKEFSVDWNNYFKGYYMVVNNKLDSVLKNIGVQEPGKCLQYSDKYAKKLLNNNSAKYSILGCNDKKQILKVIAKEIRSGRPVIARVQTSTKKEVYIGKYRKAKDDPNKVSNTVKMCTRHFVTVVRNKKKCKFK